MEADTGGKIHVAHTIPVRHAERLVPKVVADAPEAAACHRVLAGVNDRHAPVFDTTAEHVHAIGPQVKTQVRLMEKVIGEVILDLVTAIPAANHEIADTMRSIDLHDVPEDGPSADFDQWFR